MPIRWRLTLWFCLILFAILVFSDVIVYDLIENHLNQQVDNRLRAHSAEVHGTLKADGASPPVDYEIIHESLPPINQFASPGIYIQIIDANGMVVAKSSNLGDQELPLDPALVAHGFEGNEALATVPAGKGTSVRIMVSPLYLTDEMLLLEVGESLEPVDRTLSQMRWYLTAVTLGALVAAAAAGTVLARRALAPVNRIRETAGNIEDSSDLSQRVGHIGPRDEIGKLAEAFDHLIAHLEKAFESQKQFVADASHELRNPLTVIRGNLDLLKLDLGKEDRLESLRAIGGEVERMTTIVNDLLLLAELETQQTQRKGMVSLRPMLLDVFEQVGKLSSKHEIVLGPHHDLSVPGDSEALRRLMTNLIDNALKYTPEGGRVTLSLTRDGEYARFDVADTGVGLASEHLPHVFDRFYRADKSRSRVSGSSGLGLAIVKEIAERHGGRVSVDSLPGKGSTFSVWLKL